MMVYVVQWDDKSLSFTSQLWSKNRECEGKHVWTLTEPHGRLFLLNPQTKNLFYWWTIKWVWQFHKALKWSRYVSFVIGPLDFSSSEGRNTRRKKTRHNGSLKCLATQVSGAAAAAFYVLLLHHTTLHLQTDQ